MINTYLNFILKRPLLPILLLAAVTVYLALGILKIQFDSSIESFMPKHDAEYIEYSAVKEIYGDNDRFAQISIAHDHLWHADTLATINQMIVDIEAYEEFDQKKEDQRLEKLEVAARRSPVTFSNVLSAFSDDPVFARFLLRKIPDRIQHNKVLTAHQIEKIRKAILTDRALKETEIIDTLLTPFTAKDISGDNDTLETYDLIDTDDQGNRIIPRTKEEIVAFRERLTRNPAYENRL